MSGSVFSPCFVILYLCLSNFAIILMVKRELLALYYLSSWCLVSVSVLWLFLMVPLVGLQCVIAAFPDSEFECRSRSRDFSASMVPYFR